MHIRGPSENDHKQGPAIDIGTEVEDDAVVRRAVCAPGEGTVSMPRPVISATAGLETTDGTRGGVGWILMDKTDFFWVNDLIVSYGNKYKSFWEQNY